jgi:hypothetical protein
MIFTKLLELHEASIRTAGLNEIIICTGLEDKSFSHDVNSLGILDSG